MLRQSGRAEAYRAALDLLARTGATYPCACSRREIGDGARAGVDGGLVYPGTCRAGLPPGRAARALRVRVGNAVIRFDDAVQGGVRHVLADDVGDFVLQRADGLCAYQLAVVVDDAAQGVTDVVRGADLLDSTPRQIFLQRLLGLPTPRYLHLPVATDARGVKLSKQTGAPPIDRARPGAALAGALRFLGQRVDAELVDDRPAVLLASARALGPRVDSARAVGARAGLTKRYCARSARKVPIARQYSSWAPRSLCPAPGIPTQRFGPAHAAKRRRECSGGTIASRSPTSASSGTPIAGARASESNGCFSSQRTGRNG